MSVVHVMPLVKYPGLKKAGDKLIEQSVRRLVKAGFTAEPVCRFGRPAEEIMKTASKAHADLIVMGTHGHSGLRGALVGSVAQKVLNKSTVPVMVVR